MPLAVDLNALTLRAHLELVVVAIFINTPVLTAWAILADRARRVLRSEQALKRLKKGSATIMAGATAAIATF